MIIIIILSKQLELQVTILNTNNLQLDGIKWSNIDNFPTLQKWSLTIRYVLGHSFVEGSCPSAEDIVNIF